MSATEYDRFGPWIDEVTSPADVPRLYRDHPLDLDAARLVLKVPRDVHRREVTAGMDLYDHLLVVDATTLTVLSRRATERPAGRRGDRAAPAGTGYDVRTVPLAHVVAVRESVDLLDGRLTVRTEDGGALAVRFSGSSRAQVTRLVDLLREGATSGAPTLVGRALAAAGGALAPCPLDPGRDDLALVADVTAAVRANPALVPWTCHGRTPLTVRAAGVATLAARVSHALSPATLQGAVVAGDDRAVEVHARSAWVTRGRVPQHSASRLVLPLARLEAISLSPHPLYDGVVEVTCTLGRSEVGLVAPEGSALHALVAGVAA